MPEKEGTPLKRLGIGGCNPEEGGARVPCPWGPVLDRTQEPSTVEMHPEETPKDCGHDSQACIGEHEGQPTAGLGCTGRGAATQRTDSLEETLQELEATLRQMGTAPTEGPPGSPPPPPSGPQVAASSSVLLSCLPVFRAGGSGGLQEHHGSSLLPLILSQLLPPSCEPGARWGLQAEPWEAGKLASPGISPSSPGRDQGFSPRLCICNPANKVFSPFSISTLPSPSPL